MNKLTNQHHRLFVWSLHLAGLAVVALTTGGFFTLVYQPLQRQQADYLSQSEQLDWLLLKTGTEGSDYRKLRNQLDKMEASVAEMYRQLAGQSSESSVIKELTGLAAKVDLEVLDYHVGLSNSMPTHSQTEVEFRCHGSYASICRFLQQAEQLTKTTKLARFELDSRDNSHGYPIQLTFVLYSEGKSNDTKEKRGVL